MSKASIYGTVISMVTTLQSFSPHACEAFARDGVLVVEDLLSPAQVSAVKETFRGTHSGILPGPDYDAVFHDAEGQPASCEAIRRTGV